MTDDLSQCGNCIYHYTYNGRDMCKQVGDDFYLQWKVENCPYHTSITKVAAISDEIYRLKAENAELRARLDKAAEFPCKPGDTIYWLCEDEKTIHEGIVVNFDIEESGIWVFCKYYKDDFTYWHTLECFCEDVYTDKTEAESRLAELKGEKKNG